MFFIFIIIKNMLTIRKVIWVVIIIIIVHIIIQKMMEVSVRVKDCKPNGNEAGYICSFTKDGKMASVVSTQYHETDSLIHVHPYLMDKSKFYMVTDGMRMTHKVALLFLVFLDIVMMYEEKQSTGMTPQPGSAFRSFFSNFGRTF